MSIDLKGNTNYVLLRDKPTIDPDTGVSTPGPFVVPRTALSAVDLIAGNDIIVENDTISVREATVQDVVEGTTASGVITANTLKAAVEGGYIQPAAAPVSDIVGGTGSTMVTPNGLKGAVSAGKAVDVTSTPSASAGTVDTGLDIKGTVTWTGTDGGNFGFFDADSAFPKYADGLVYLLMADVNNTGSTSVTLSGEGALNDTLPVTLAAGESARVAMLFAGATTGFIAATVSGAFSLEFTHLREFEVTGCSDAAREYIGTIPDPDNVDDFYLLEQDMVNPWLPIINMGDSPEVLVEPGLGYKVNAQSGTHTLSVANMQQGKFGQDAYLEIYVGDTGLISVERPLILVNALTAHAVNNCTVKFRDNVAKLIVEDTVSDYIVTVTAGTEGTSVSGSLYYGLTGTTAGYIVFDSSLNGSTVTVPTGSTVTRTDMTLLGNGVENTIISANGVLHNAWETWWNKTDYIYLEALTLKDTDSVRLPIVGTNIVIDGCKECETTISSAAVFQVGALSNSIVKNCIAPGFANGLLKPTANTKFTNCLITGNTCRYGMSLVSYSNVVFDHVSYIDNVCSTYAMIMVNSSAPITVTGCTFSNPSTNTGAVYLYGSVGTTAYITDCYFVSDADILYSRAATGYNVTYFLNGTNKFNADCRGVTGIYKIVAGSTLDLTDNQEDVIIYGENPSSSLISGASIAVVASTASDAAVGGTATVLYNDNGTTKSRSISGGGTGYIMRANGAMGVPVTTTEFPEDGEGASGSLKRLLDDSTVSQITFAPVIDGSTINIPSGYTCSRALTINGAGSDKTTLHYVGAELNMTASGNSMSSVSLKGCTASTANRGTVWRGNLYDSVIDNCKTGNYGIINLCTNTMRGCTLTSNNVGFSEPGPVVFSLLGNNLIENCNFVGNKAAAWNGIIDVYLSVTTIKNCTFTNSQSITALRLQSSAEAHGTASIAGCTFDSNSYISVVGGGSAGNGMLTIDDGNVINSDIGVQTGATVSFAGNNVFNGTASGGGHIQIVSGTVTGGVFGTKRFLMSIDTATVSGATITGGLDNSVGVSNNTVSLINCLVTGNTASASGGGVAMYGGDLVVITGCTFTGNRAYYNNDAFYSAARHVILNDFEASQGTSGRSAYIQIGAGTTSYPMILDLNDIRTDGAINVLGGNLLNEIRIVAGSTVSIKGNSSNRAIYIRQDLTGLHCQISVGSYDDSGEWVVGGTASFITYDGSSTVSISGTGTTSLTNTGVLS